jgi:hypothetical protein
MRIVISQDGRVWTDQDMHWSQGGGASLDRFASRGRELVVIDPADLPEVETGIMDGALLAGDISWRPSTTARGLREDVDELHRGALARLALERRLREMAAERQQVDAVKRQTKAREVLRSVLGAATNDADAADELCHPEGMAAMRRALALIDGTVDA